MNPFFLVSIHSTEARKMSSKKDGFTFGGNKLWIPNLLIREMHYGSDQSFVSLEVIDIRMIGSFLFAIGFSINYVLFTVWGLIKLYHAGQFKLVWILDLMVLNAVDYLLFWIKNKKKYC